MFCGDYDFEYEYNISDRDEDLLNTKVELGDIEKDMNDDDAAFWLLAYKKKAQKGIDTSMLEDLKQLQALLHEYNKLKYVRVKI